MWFEELGGFERAENIPVFVAYAEAAYRYSCLQPCGSPGALQKAENKIGNMSSSNVLLASGSDAFLLVVKQPWVVS